MHRAVLLTAVVGLTWYRRLHRQEIIRGGFLRVDHGRYGSGGGAGASGVAPHAAHYPAAGAAHHFTWRVLTKLSASPGDGDGLCAGDAGAVLHHPDDLQPHPVIPLLMVALPVLAITSVLSLIQYLVERGWPAASAARRSIAPRRQPSRC